jgi:hypothetical protein
VRPVGSGVDPLLLNAAQVGRRSRGWWRALLDQYGASDVIMPEVQLKHAYPGGPAIGRFTARYGPDAELLGTFELRVERQDQIPEMLAQGVQRMDALYVRAFNAGLLSPDPTLITPREFLPPPPPPPPTELPDEEGGPSSRSASDEAYVEEEPAPTPTPVPPVSPTPTPTPTPPLPPEPQG